MDHGVVISRVYTEARFPFKHTQRNTRKALRKEKHASKIKSTPAQVTQLTQVQVLAQENATIESILFFTQRTQRKRLRFVRCVRLNGNRALVQALGRGDPGIYRQTADSDKPGCRLPLLSTGPRLPFQSQNIALHTISPVPNCTAW